MNYQCLFIVGVFLTLRDPRAYGQDSMGKPTTTEKVYVEVGESANLPCLGDFRKTVYYWTYKHGGDTLKGRVQVSLVSPSLFILSIKDVISSDAGNFTCSTQSGNDTLTLVVIEPSVPRVIRVKSVTSREVVLAWSAPKNNTEVKGYTIHIKEMTETGERGSRDIQIDEVSPSKKEMFTVKGLKPSAEYEIRLSAKYPNGVDTEQRLKNGPKSSCVTVKMKDIPLSDLKIQAVEAREGQDNSIVISWILPFPRPAKLLGFNVTFRSLRNGKSHTGEVNITSASDETDTESSWQAVLEDMKPRIKYGISVRPILASGLGPPPSTVFYRIKGMSPQLSIRAAALGPDTVVVSYDVMGRAKVKDVQIFMAQDGDTQWKNVGLSKKKKYVVAMNLNPNTKYFFQAKAKQWKKIKAVVTHVVTPPSELPVPRNVRVGPYNNGAAYVSWRVDSVNGVKGLMVTAERKLPDGTYRFDSQVLVPKTKRGVYMSGLTEGLQYQFKVTPYGMNGPGLATEPVELQTEAVSATDTPDEQSSPEFESYLPRQMEIVRGEALWLPCRARGTPMPLVQWYVNGAPWEEKAAESKQLIIRNVEEAMTVVCRAENPAGSKIAVTDVGLVGETGGSIPQATKKINAQQMTSSTSSSSSFSSSSASSASQSSSSSSPSTSSSSFSSPSASSPTPSITTPSTASSTVSIPSSFSTIPTLSSPQSSPTSSFSSSFVSSATMSSDSSSYTFSSSPTSTSSASTQPPSFTCCPCVEDTDTSPTTIVSRATSTTTPVTDVQEENHTKPATRPFVLTLQVVDAMSTAIRLVWFVTKGDTKNLNTFLFYLQSEKGQKLSSQVNKHKRTIRVEKLFPKTRYDIKLEAIGAGGVVLARDVVTVRTLPAVNPPEPMSAELVVQANEIRAFYFYLSWVLKGVDPSNVAGFRITLGNGNSEKKNVLLNRDIPRDSRIFLITGLLANRRFSVMIETVGTDGKAFLVCKISFETPSPGEDGDPVIGSSGSMMSTTATTSTDTDPAVTKTSAATSASVTSTAETATSKSPQFTTAKESRDPVPPVTPKPAVYFAFSIANQGKSSDSKKPLAGQANDQTTDP